MADGSAIAIRSSRPSGRGATCGSGSSRTAIGETKPQPLQRDRQGRLGEPAQPAVRVADPAQGRVRRVRARRRRLPRLDDHRRAPLHDAPRTAAGQHDARARPDDALADVARARRSSNGARAARARPARVPDGAPPRRARASAASRGTRRSTSSPTASARAGPDRLGLYLTARGITNEVYYVAQKAARFLGTNNVDNAARVCHAPSTTALKETIGVAATTCSYTDVIDSDLIVLFGANVANAQPVFMKYLYLAKKRGAKVAVVNPLREPGLERYWVPRNVESAMFGTKMTDEFFGVHTGGDVAFLNGVLKVLLARRRHRPRVRHASTRTGFDELLDGARGRVVRPTSSARRARPAPTWSASPRMYSGAKSAVLVWSMGITQHEHGVDNVRGDRQPRRSRAATSAGRAPGSCRSAATPVCRAAPRWAATPPRSRAASPIDERQRRRARASSTASRCRRRRGLDAERDGRGRAPRRARRALVERRQLPRRAARPRRRRAPRSRACRCASTRTSSLSHQMLVDPGETVVLLPAATRYEQRGGGTATTTERRIAFSPEIAGPRVGEARSEWEIFVDVARRVHPDRADRSRLRRPREAIRDEIARVVPVVRGHRDAARDRRRGPVGRRRACAKAASSRRPTAGRTSRVVVPPRTDGRPGRFVLTTRRGKQFNTMVWTGRRPAHRRGTRRAARCPRPTPATLGVADGRRGARAIAARRDARARARRADPARQRAGVLPRGQRAARAEPARPGVGRARLQRGRRGGPGRVTPDDAARAASTTTADARRATRSPRIDGATRRRDRTERPGPVRARPRRRRRRAARCSSARRCAIVSEESGVDGALDAPITVVLDPVDGSTNCARGIPYWAISLCAVDADGPLVRARREPRDRAAHHRGPRRRRVPRRRAACARRPRRASRTSRDRARRAARARAARWKQFRAFGCAALDAVRRRRRRPRRLRRRAAASRARGTTSAATSCAAKRARRCSTRTASRSSPTDPTRAASSSRPGHPSSPTALQPAAT